MMNALVGLLALSAAQAADAADGQCGALAGAEALLDETRGQVLVIGELHGTNEAPGFAGALACLALTAGESVALGLEMSSDEQAALDAFMDGQGDGPARTDLLAGSFWDGQDGRATEAMARLLEAAQGWRSMGLAIEARALDFGDADADLFEQFGQDGLRDRAMVRNALDAARRVDRVIVLVGNIHARRTAFEFGERRIDTMGTLSEPGDFAFVNTVYGAGEAWNCRMIHGAHRCQSFPAGSDTVSGDPRVLSDAETEAFRTRDAYDHFVFLGPATVSPPVRPKPVDD